MKFGYTIMDDQQMLLTKKEDSPKEIKPEDYLKDRENLNVPCTLELDEISAPGSYADLTEIDTHMQEFTNLVQEMQQKFANETKLLEGTPIPTYESIVKNENNTSNK